jgi:excisionase family DNA binding protein
VSKSRSALRSITLLTSQEVGNRLRCSENHIYRLIASGKLRAVDIAQPGSRRPKTRVRSDDLDAYIDACTRTTRAAYMANSSQQYHHIDGTLMP